MLSCLYICDLLMLPIYICKWNEMKWKERKWNEMKWNEMMVFRRNLPLSGFELATQWSEAQHATAGLRRPAIYIYIYIYLQFNQWVSSFLFYCISCWACTILPPGSHDGHDYRQELYVEHQVVLRLQWVLCLHEQNKTVGSWGRNWQYK